MDTDELSDEAYQGIIVEAEKFLHDLTLHFGVLASRCKNEEEYINLALKLIKEIRAAKENEYLDIFFGHEPSIKSVHQVLDRMEKNIKMINKIRLIERNFSRWEMPRYIRELKQINKKNSHRS